MNQISARKMKELATDIENELHRLERLETEIKQVQKQIDQYPNLTNVFHESLALKLHNFYTGCERIFQIVASEINGGLPSSYDWHRRLLYRMTTQQENRPPLLKQKTGKILEEYLAFRHVIRNIYGFELDPKRLQKLVDNYSIVWQNIKQDIQEFIDWLRDLANSLE